MSLLSHKIIHAEKGQKKETFFNIDSTNNQNDNHLARPDSLQLQGYQLFWEELLPEFVVQLESSRASRA